MDVRKELHNSVPLAPASLIKREMSERPLVYVASPFSGDVERNIMNARRYCRFAAESGRVPLAPHLLLPQFISEEKERTEAMRMNMVFLGKCEELWVFGDTVTEGMAAEIAGAEMRGMPVRYFTDRCEEKKWAY